MTDVWIADLGPFFPGDGDTPVSLSLQELSPGILSEAETDRAKSFPVPREGVRFAASRFFLRSVLSEYAERPPGELEFQKGPGGKPSLAAGAAAFRFNLSHSADAALLGVSDSDVGVDIEKHRKVKDLDGLVEYAFVPEEAELFRRLPRGMREDVFFRAWCVKEAVIKAWGERAALYLDRIRVVTPAPGTGGAEEGMVYFEDSFEWKSEPYRARLLDLLPGYSAAVCLRGPEMEDVRIRRYLWPPSNL